MSELAVLVVGLVLCFAGARSLRLTVLVAGFGLCWLLADAFGASVATTFVVAAVGALALLVLSIVMSRFVIFVVGAAVGAVIGARLFALLGGDDPIRQARLQMKDLADRPEDISHGCLVTVGVVLLGNQLIDPSLRL